MRHAAFLLLTASALALTGCGGGSGSEPAGELVTDSVHFDAAGTESAAITLKIGVGDLDVSGGAAGLVDGKLEYNVPSWKPTVTQSKDGTAARVVIEQPSSVKSHGNTQNHWTLKASDAVPTTFDIQSGVGKTSLNLGSMKLRGLTLTVGVGTIEVDLRGNPDHDYSVKVKGGVGETTIHLPADASVRANVQGGIAPVKVEGLEKHGGVWESADYGKAKPSIDLDVTAGVGEIHIVK